MDHKLVFQNSLKAIQGLEPALVWKKFFDITQIPRPSKKEQKMVEFAKKWCEEHKFEHIIDEVGNVIIRIPASKPEFANKPTVCLQGHMDMVCEKEKGKVIDFEKDPIELTRVEDGKYIKAVGTSLGADNGIGVAFGMAIAEMKDIIHGPLEILLTVDEETGLTGAAHLKAGLLKAKYFCNLDSEAKDVFTVGCAGGQDSGAIWNIEWTEAPKEALHAFKLEIGGLAGGHSGCDINVGRANSIKLMGRLLDKILNDMHKKLYIHYFQGGSKRNAIPRDCVLDGYVDLKLFPKSEFEHVCDEFKKLYMTEFGLTDPNLKVDLKIEENEDKSPKKVFVDKFLSKIVNVILAFPHGVLKMSAALPGLVETSSNLATIDTFFDKNELMVYTSQRSSVDFGKRGAVHAAASVFKLGGADKILHSDGYPGWAPNSKSKLLEISVNTWKEMFATPGKKEPIVEAIHAGLECGLISGVYPDMEMISWGPTMFHVHSPDEKLLIEDVAPVFKFTVKFLEKIATSQ